MNIYTKFCSKCNTEKSILDFNKCHRTGDGLQTQCKSCDKLWRDVNKTKHRASIAAWKATHKDQCKAADKIWSAEHRDKRNATEAKRRATKLQATSGWYSIEHTSIQAIYAEAKMIEEQTGILHHVDHIVPLQSDIVCGLHCLANLQILTAKENCSKGNQYWPDMP
jgi:hypothetical protein